MIENRIILENRFKGHQIFMLILLPSIVLIALLEKMDYSSNTNLKYIFIVFTFVLILSIIFSLSKKGLLISKKGLFKAYFLLNKSYYKRKINVNNKNIVSILNVRSTYKVSFDYHDNIDTGSKFNKFNLCLLNNNHLTKEIVIALQSEKIAKKGAEYLTRNLDLTFEKYNPKRN